MEQRTLAADLISAADLSRYLSAVLIFMGANFDCFGRLLLCRIHCVNMNFRDVRRSAYVFTYITRRENICLG